MEETFEIFDENNEHTGTAPRSQVHKEGLFHRGVIIFLVNSNGGIFLHKRAETKDTSPGLWDYSTGEHLKPNETAEEAVIRGLKEELGIKNAEITKLRDWKLNHIDYENGNIDNEFDSLFLAESDETMLTDPEEISEGHFFTEQEIENDLSSGNKKFTPFFLKEWPEFKRLRTPKQTH